VTEWSRPTGDGEPEIIPPGARPDRRTRIWVAEDRDAYGYRRIHVSRSGPLSLVLLGMVLGAGALIALVLLLGAVLLWLPLIGLIAVVAVVAGILRGPSRRRF
jgi:hypothetical protein